MGTGSLGRGEGSGAGARGDTRTGMAQWFGPIGLLFAFALLILGSFRLESHYWDRYRSWSLMNGFAAQLLATAMGVGFALWGSIVVWRVQQSADDRAAKSRDRAEAYDIMRAVAMEHGGNDSLLKKIAGRLDLSALKGQRVRLYVIDWARTRLVQVGTDYRV